MQQIIGIYGASGFGREMLPLARTQYADVQLCFVDDVSPDNEINGYPVYTYQDYLELPNTDKSIILAIADSKIRETLAAKCHQDNLIILSVKSSIAIVKDAVEIGEGALLCNFTSLASNVKVGQHFQINSYGYVGHDCIIGDYVTFGPRVSCNGNIHVHDHAYIGTGAVIKQGTSDKPLIIGEGAIVGMGAVVTKDVPAGAVVVGNPAKVLVK